MNNQENRIITLTTDFGLCDWFVGTMKGVILSIAPQSTIVDINHNIPQGDIKAAAFSLLSSFRYFPENTIHVVVVDPGVGSKRKTIVVRTKRYWFVAPNNGVLSYAINIDDIVEIREIENDQLTLKRTGNTFHGRDVFAPVAAYIAMGIEPTQIGKKLKDLVKIRLPIPKIRENKIVGEIIYIDHFGNVITNIPFKKESDFLGCTVIAGNRMIGKIHNFYAAVNKGASLGIRGSTGFIELAVRDGDISKKYNLKIGAKVELLETNR